MGGILVSPQPHPRIGYLPRSHLQDSRKFLVINNYKFHVVSCACLLQDKCKCGQTANYHPADIVVAAFQDIWAHFISHLVIKQDFFEKG